MSKISLEEAKSIKLSKNFTLAEFIKSDVALRRGIDNSMPREYLPRIQYLVDNVLQPVRDKFGPIRILSGYRSVLLCIAVGSNEHSNHAYAFAADIEPYDANIPLSSIIEYIGNELEFKELIAEFFPNGWVHVATQESNNKMEIKLKDPDVSYEHVALETILAKYSTVA